MLAIAAGIASLSWAPVTYRKSNWEEGGSKCIGYFTQFALFILFVILITPRLLVFTAGFAVARPIFVFMYFAIRWLTLSWFTIWEDNDVDFSSNLSDKQKFLINIGR